MTGPRVVVIGAGVVGAALADELTARGWTDVTVLDRGELPLPGGSSSHAPGLVFQTNPSRTMAGFARYTVEKLSALEIDGLPCFNQVGGLEVATTPERMGELARRHGLATSWGIDSRLVDAGGVRRHAPAAAGGQRAGRLPHPDRRPGRRAARGRRAAGPGRSSAGRPSGGSTRVLDVTSAGGQVTGVVTDQGEIPADVVVSATGFWGPRTGAMVGLTRPAAADGPPVRPHRAAGRAGRAQPGHHDPFDASAPILRHQDRDLYFREHGDRVGIGSYAHDPMPVDLDDARRRPDAQRPGVHPGRLRRRPGRTPSSCCPRWRDRRGERLQRRLLVHPRRHPADRRAPRTLRGFWVAEAVWVTHSAGVGRALARLAGRRRARRRPARVRPQPVRAGAAHRDVRARRAAPATSSRSTTSCTRSTRREVQRPLRTSPFHARQVELGAVFDQRAPAGSARAGSRPTPQLPEVGKIPARDEWAARHWSPIAGGRGPGHPRPGRAVRHDPAQAPRGHRARRAGPAQRPDHQRPRQAGRLGHLHAAAGRARRRPQRPDRGPAGRADLPGRRQRPPRPRPGCCARAGPDVHDHRHHRRHLLHRAVGAAGARRAAPRSPPTTSPHAGFGYFKARELARRPACRCARCALSYVGELGWELYASAELGLRLWDVLWDGRAPPRRHRRRAQRVRLAAPGEGLPLLRAPT